jgi:biotin transport system substrate-specific component
MRVQDIAYIALFAAFTAVLGLIPRVDIGAIPVPITAQSLGPMLAGSILGARRGFLSQALFLLLVAAGLPLLSGGRGGLGVFAGPSAGFLLAFPLAAAVIGFGAERLWRRLSFAKLLGLNLLGGVGIIHGIGIPVFALLSNAPIASALIFLPGDVLKAVLAAMLAMFVRRGYPLIEQKREAAALDDSRSTFH